MSMGEESLDRLRVLGARVQSLREQRGWTQGQLAYKAATTATQVSRIERNERPGVQAITVAALANALGTTVEYLMGMTNDPRPLPGDTTPDLDPAHLARLQRLAERVARLPEDRQRIVMDALLTLLNVEDALRDVQEGEFLPESEEAEPNGP